MKHHFFKKYFLQHLIAFIVFLIISIVYLYPELQGRRIAQNDVMQWKGMSKEVNDYREKTNENILWTNSMFSGMPTYLITTRFVGNQVATLKRVLFGWDYRGGILILLLSFISFYILLLSFNVNKWLSIAGAIGFGLSSYFIIIIEAGHITKTHAIIFVPILIAGIHLAYNKKLLLGLSLTALGLAFEIVSNHLQITYYAMLIVILFVIAEFFYKLKEKQLKQFLKTSILLVFVSIFAVITNISMLYFTNQYTEYSIRGKSELSADKENKTSGLDKDYAMAWSYGIMETFNLFIPNLYGGKSGGELGTNSKTYKFLEGKVPNANEMIKQMPLYWGEQPFTSGPSYIGAVIIFLFIFSLFFVKKKILWSFIPITILATMLAWGGNFPIVSDFFIKYVPLYNKFRSVSMILVIVSFTVLLIAILGINSIIQNINIDKKKLIKKLMISLYITGGICLIFAILPNMFFNFSSSNDAEMIKSGYPQEFMNALREDRSALLIGDAWRSLAFVLLTFGAIWLYLKNKLKLQYFIFSLALLIFIDLWTIDRRYLNSDNFIPKSQTEVPYQPTKADLQILQDNDINYRVMNLTTNTFNDAATSYFHKSIGGYHAAKLRRYQDLIEHHISKNNMNVLNMLNAKYFIIPSEDKESLEVQKNPMALGNAWFVRKYKIVANADEEINALTKFNPYYEAIIDKRFESFVKNINLNSIDTSATIKLLEYAPHKLLYESSSKTEQLCVFSEIYYKDGWNVKIDGKDTEHFRVNYVLRAMIVPQGQHKIEFYFKPLMEKPLEITAATSSTLIILFFIFAVFVELKKLKINLKKEEGENLQVKANIKKKIKK